jgi:DNA-binding XRE family transcriptional regulator
MTTWVVAQVSGRSAAQALFPCDCDRPVGELVCALRRWPGLVTQGRSGLPARRRATRNHDVPKDWPYRRRASRFRSRCLMRGATTARTGTVLLVLLAWPTSLQEVPVDRVDLDSNADILITLARNLKAARLSAGLTQAQVAARAGITLVKFAQIESGHRDPDLRLLEVLANAVGCDASKLVNP